MQLVSGSMLTFLLRSAIAVLSFCLIVLPVQAARDTDSYDGNIFALYAGNGSLVPPAITLAESPAGRTSVIVYYLDDSSTSKAFSEQSRNCNGCGETALTSCP